MYNERTSGKFPADRVTSAAPEWWGELYWGKKHGKFWGRDASSNRSREGHGVMHVLCLARSTVSVHVIDYCIKLIVGTRVAQDKIRSVCGVREEGVGASCLGLGVASADSAVRTCGGVWSINQSRRSIMGARLWLTNDVAQRSDLLGARGLSTRMAAITPCI